MVAVYIDGDWLYEAINRVNSAIDYQEFIRFLKDKFGKETQVHFYGANNIIDRKQAIFYEVLKRNGYRLHLEELIKRDGAFISKGLEVALAVDVMQSLPLLKKFILVSGDGDFLPLLKRVKKAGVEVSLIGLPFTVGFLMHRVVGGNFINLGKYSGKNAITRFKLFAKENKAASRPLISRDCVYITKGDQLVSYEFLRGIMLSAKRSVIIIDQYLDEQILMLLESLRTGIAIKILTNKKNISPATKLYIKSLRCNDYLVDVYWTTAFHDRFLGVDGAWWHSGHSFKDLGVRNSLLSKIVSEKEVKKINKSVSDIIR